MFGERTASALRSADVPGSSSRRATTRSRMQVLLALGAVMVGVAACGSSSGGDAASATETYKKYAAMSGTDREDALVKAAKKEGKLVLYTTNSDDIADIVPAFEKKYGIKVEGASENSEPLRQKLELENQAHRVGADLVESLALDMRVYNNEGILAPYQNDEVTSQLDKEATEFDGFIVSSYYPYMVTWNSDEVPAGQEPTSWEDLADPKWKDKIAMVDGDGVWYASLYYYLKDQGWSDDKFVSVMKGIKANSQVATGHGSTTNLLASGDFAIDLQVFQFDYLAGLADGSPLANEPTLAPIINQPIGMGLVKTAKHPAAAQLFMDFYLTEGAKIFVQDDNRLSTNTQVQAGASFKTPSDVTIEEPLDQLDTDDKVAAWEQAYANLLHGNDDGLLPDGI